jgi:hypothetical protein
MNGGSGPSTPTFEWDFDYNMNALDAAIGALQKGGGGSSQPWVIQPVLSAARTVTDGVLNSTTLITSATAKFTQADVGACIFLLGASVGLIPVVGGIQPTIISVQNSTTATISAVPGGGAVLGVTFVIGQDNSAALNAAMVKAVAASGVLLVPAGQFIINQLNLFGAATTNATGAFAVKGAGYGQSQLLPSPYLAPTPTAPIVQFSSGTMTWDGLDMNWMRISAYQTGSYPYQGGGSGISFNGAARVQNCQFVGWSAPNAVTFECDSDDLNIQDVDVWLNQNTASVIHSLNFRANNCYFQGNYGMVIGDLSWGKVTNCTIRGNAAGLMLTGFSGGGTDNYFVNCRFSGQWNIYNPATGGIVCASFIGCSFTADAATPGFTPAFANSGGLKTLGTGGTYNFTNCRFGCAGTYDAIDNLSGNTVVLQGCQFVNYTTPVNYKWTGKSIVNPLGATLFDGGGNHNLLSNMTQNGTLVTGSN